MGNVVHKLEHNQQIGDVAGPLAFRQMALAGLTVDEVKQVSGGYSDDEWEEDDNDTGDEDDYASRASELNVPV